MSSAKLSLIIPCYNEARNLPRLIERCAAALAGSEIEVVLVDNGSTDDSARILAELLQQHHFIRSVRVPVNQGYGYGIVAGLKSATTDFIGWTHADLQTDPADALRGLAFFTTAPDSQKIFVKGLRYGRSLVDVFFTAGMSLFETMLMGRVLRDVNAQPTLFPRHFFQTWQNPPDDFSLDLYAYYMAKRAKLTIKRFPVHFGPRFSGTSNWNTGWRARMKFIWRTLTYSLRLKREIE